MKKGIGENNGRLVLDYMLRNVCIWMGSWHDTLLSFQAKG